jgi:hypothetical protein
MPLGWQAVTIGCVGMMSQSTQERIKTLKKQYAKNEVGKVTVEMVLGGMRGIPVRQGGTS